MKNSILLGTFLIVLLSSLNGFNIYLTVLFAILSYIMMPLGKYWDNQTILLCFFSFFYSSIIFLNDDVVSFVNIISYLVCPVAFYRLGLYFTRQAKTKQKYLVLWMILISAYILPLAYQTINSIREVGLINIFRTLGGEGEDNALNATLYGLHASIGLAGISVLFCKLSDIRWQKIILSICTILSLLTVIHLVNRTGLVVLIACLCICIFYSKRNKPKSLLGYIAIIAIFVIVAIASGVINEDIVEAYMYREERSDETGTTDAGGRVSLWANALDHLFTHPLGFPKERFAHNLWLDVARVSGLLPFFMFMIASIKNYIYLYRIYRRDEYEITPFILGLNVVMFLSSFVEPVMEGSVLYFCLFMFLWGCNKVICYRKWN